MKHKYSTMLLVAIIRWPLNLFADTFGDFVYNNSGTNISITGYTGTSTHVEIPDTIAMLPVSAIYPYAFDSRTNILNLVVPGSIQSIMYEAFSGCSSLTNVEFQDGVNGLDAPAFGGCVGIRSITLPASATNATHFAFSGCANLTNYSISSGSLSFSSIDGVWFSKDHKVLIGYPQGNSGRYIVPNGVTQIENGAFGECHRLDGVSLPETITDIQPNAFINSGIFGLTIPNGVDAIGYRTFYGCSRLERIVFWGNEPPEPPEPQWMFYNTQVTVIYYRAGTAWSPTYANIPTMRCTATTPDPIAHSSILADFPAVTTDEEFEQAANADQDSDGVPSWEEYVAGTSPTNTAEYPSVAGITPSGVVSWFSATSRFYFVYLNSSLNNLWPEETLYRIRGDGHIQSFTNDLTSGIGFHRVGVELYR